MPNPVIDNFDITNKANPLTFKTMPHRLMDDSQKKLI